MTLSGRNAAIALLLIQSAIALSVAGKYALDRATKPRVWVRAQQVDPSTPLRGRYLALQLTVNACSLTDSDIAPFDFENPQTTFSVDSSVQTWPVELLAENGQLEPHLMGGAPSPNSNLVSLRRGQDCHKARLNRLADFFLPEQAASALPRAPDAVIWVEVTVPSTGPPRPIQLAVSDKTGWHILKQ